MYKRTIKLRIHNPLCDFRRAGFNNGNWIDLASNGEYSFVIPNIGVRVEEGFEFRTFHINNVYIPLGVSMTLPKWYKAEIKPRSSTFANYGIIQTNSIGEIEWNFSKEYMFPALAFKKTTLKSGERFCQFQIKLCENAPWYMKIADLFRSGFKFKEVDILTTTRGGLGSTGK